MGRWRSRLKDAIVDVEISDALSLGEFVELLSRIHGFTAGRVFEASKILAEMASRSDVVKFFSFTGNLVATGLRGLIAQMIREKLVNVVITTCGTIDHDIARATGGTYYKGFFEVDDVELSRDKIHRLGNVFIPWESYGERIENFTRELVEEAASEKEEWGVRELLEKAGLKIDDEHSILRAATESKVPIYVPGILDGAFGTHLWINSQFKKFKLNTFKDMEELSNIIFKAKKTGGLIVGGGISKHHLIWWNQFRGGLDYAIYLTTAMEYDGSLSGAMPREAISWGKVKPKARKVAVIGDATVLLPLIYAGAKKLMKRRG